ncbi:hypothetical protein NE237_021360 [Protea cynaroides]|uniref:CCHC-type domain-containing protein n=1 Tax=Protea cynaroides TaxID=273540 RepID=A0A9Q0HB54_9MAGN|nr:hypothetical protein NE237_021360 [Protea cynaroides]
MRCFKCGTYGHRANSCPNKEGLDKQTRNGLVMEEPDNEGNAHALPELSVRHEGQWADVTDELESVHGDDGSGNADGNVNDISSLNAEVARSPVSNSRNEIPHVPLVNSHQVMILDLNVQSPLEKHD